MIAKIAVISAYCNAVSRTMDEAMSDPVDPVDFLMRVHYNFFMANPRFWYERDLVEADAIVVRAASDLRREVRRHD